MRYYWVSFFLNRYVLSSEYVFELLKADMNFAQRDEMMHMDTTRHLANEGIQLAVEAMFVYASDHRVTVLKPEFDNELIA